MKWNRRQNITVCYIFWEKYCFRKMSVQASTQTMTSEFLVHQTFLKVPWLIQMCGQEEEPWGLVFSIGKQCFCTHHSQPASGHPNSHVGIVPRPQAVHSLSATKCIFLLAKIFLFLSSCFEAHTSLGYLPELPFAPTD